MNQVADLYKEIWQTDELPPCLRSKYTDSGTESTLALFTTRTVLPTSIFLVFLVWGIIRLRRRQEDVELATESFMALWAMAFAVVKECVCRVRRQDGSLRGFNINPMSQVAFLNYLFTQDVRQRLEHQWQNIYNTKRRKWMSTPTMDQAGVLEVFLFLMTYHYNTQHGIISQLLRCFSSVVDKMGTTSKDSLLSAKTTTKNSGIYNDTIGRKKERCAHFLLRENVSWRVFVW